MNRRILVAVLLFAVLLPVMAAGEQVVDTVYLKDGSVLKGTIKSLTDTSLRIVTTTGLDLTIAMDKVARFERGKVEPEAAAPAAEANADAAHSPSR